MFTLCDLEAHAIQVARIFNEAAQISPEDADVHIVLGVLYNLSREYDKAIDSFKTAIELKPHDYSLWNKLGATQANSVQSAEAIEAYQQVAYSCHLSPPPPISEILCACDGCQIFRSTGKVRFLIEVTSST